MKPYPPWHSGIPPDPLGAILAVDWSESATASWTRAMELIEARLAERTEEQRQQQRKRPGPAAEPARGATWFNERKAG